MARKQVQDEEQVDGEQTDGQDQANATGAEGISTDAPAKDAPASRPHAYRMPPVGGSRDDTLTRFFIAQEEAIAKGHGEYDADNLSKLFTEAFTAHMGDAPRVGKPGQTAGE